MCLLVSGPQLRVMMGMIQRRLEHIFTDGAQLRHFFCRGRTGNMLGKVLFRSAHLALEPMSILAIAVGFAVAVCNGASRIAEIAIRIAGVFMSLVLLAVIAFALALIWGW